MKAPLSAALLVLFALVVGLLAYGAGGRSDALSDSVSLARKANWLIAHDRGGDDLGPGRAAILLAVEDPNFLLHEGDDFGARPGGSTTLTQALAQRLAFERYRPGIAEIRRAGYVRGLEQRLTKAQILALWLETVEMGRSRVGGLRGLFTASRVVYGRPPSELTNAEFLRLVAVVIAPARFHLEGPGPALDERVERIERLISGHRRAASGSDLELQECA